jgi:polyisoprenoid-binding protein YceI
MEKGTSRFLQCRAMGRGFFLFSLALTWQFVPSVRAQETIVTLDPAQTYVEFTLGAMLHTVHGSFKLKSGQIRFDPSSGKASGAIIVDAASGNSENDGRDKKMHQQVLESQKFAEIIFTPNQIKGPIAAQGTSEVELSGVIRLHGQDHDLTLPIVVSSAAGGKIHATSRFSVPYVKWGLKNPSTFFLRVDDAVGIEIRATAQLISAPAPH